MKRIFAPLLALLVLAVACSGDTKLKNLVDEFNKECPVSLGSTGTMDKAEYDGQTVTIIYTMNGEYFDIESFRQNEEMFHANMLESYANNQQEGFKLLIDAIVKAKANMDVVFNSTTGDSYTFHFTADEIAANRPTDDADPEVLLTTTVKATKAQLPLEIGNGLTFADVLLDSESMTYVYECDEDIYDIDLFQQQLVDNRDTMLGAVLNSNDPMMQRMLKMLKSCGRSFVMKYVGATSGKAAVITATPDEL